MEEINKQIELYYPKLYDIALSITKNDEKATDLLHLVIEDVLYRKNKNKIKDAIKNNLFSYYIYKGMYNQFYSKNSKYDKELRLKYEINSDTEYIIYDDEYDENIDLKSNKIKELVRNNFSWYEYELFKLYYCYEDKIDLKEYTLKEVENFRNMSLRKLQIETKIHYVSISKTIKFVVDTIKNKYNNMKKCPCGKEYIREDYYQKHIETCEIYQKSIQNSDNLKQNSEETIKFSSKVKEEVDEKIEVKKALVNYFNAIKGLYPSAMTEWRKLYSWYRLLIPRDPGDLNCLGCRRNVYNALFSLYNEIK